MTVKKKKFIRGERGTESKGLLKSKKIQLTSSSKSRDLKPLSTKESNTEVVDFPEESMYDPLKQFAQGIDKIEIGLRIQLAGLVLNLFLGMENINSGKFPTLRKGVSRNREIEKLSDTWKYAGSSIQF